MTKALNDLGLLSPIMLEYGWFVRGCGSVGVINRLILGSPIDDPSVPGRVLGSRPSAFPDAQLNHFDVIGSGTWFDATGKSRRDQLVELTVWIYKAGMSARISVHHDIWKWFDFTGRPHPEVYNRNAPRLAEALRKLNAVLGVELETGETTYYGTPMESGIVTPDPDENGMGLDVTDLM
ncbi:MULTISPECIES: hypothetical protein [Streptomyces]|uniref:hypothetical protein n=1 Tax=Streptomyces TaxID=1883 RepID=UPI001D15B28E|nr:MULTISPECIES: hypothetical protein [Streptomyces]MCC3653171.1 hypothetical protein [Streptomyces sp. S07_1.15]WSQ72230.1 hypothetical protein OG463_12770 [Streptomyces xinghaiensis]